MVESPLARDLGSRLPARPPGPCSEGKESPGHLCPVRRIAESEGLEILEASSLPPGIRARLVADTVELAKGDAEVVKRFSIAHELGHHRLGTTHDQGRSVESEANAFAGELLVPGELLLEVTSRNHGHAGTRAHVRGVAASDPNRSAAAQTGR